MARIYAFNTSGQHQPSVNEAALRRTALLPLQKKGILGLAETSYDTLINDDKFKDIRQLTSPIVKDAYLHFFAHITASEQDLEETLSKIDYGVTINRLHNVRNLINYGPEYLESHNAPSTLSDSLFAAAIAFPQMRNTAERETYSSLIGAEAYEMIHAAQIIEDDPYHFHDETTSYETRLLHLIMLKPVLADMLHNAEFDGIENDDTQLRIMDNLTLNIHHLHLLPHKNTLEERICTRAKELGNALKYIHQENAPHDHHYQIY